MRIGILGSGLMGGKLGTVFARAGHEVVFSYARSEQKLKNLARNAKGNAAHGTPREARTGSGRNPAGRALVANGATCSIRAGDLSGKVVVTCSLPMNEHNTALVIGHTSSGAEELQRKFRRPASYPLSTRCPAKFCSACTKPGAAPPTQPGLLRRTTRRQRIAAELIRDAGFEPVDAGPLRIARYTEPFALLIGRAGVRRAGGPELAYRFERFARRD